MKNTIKQTKSLSRLSGRAFLFFLLSFMLLNFNNAYSAPADSVDVKWTVTMNNGFNFRAKIQIKSANVDIKLGSTTLIFNFNNSGLSNIGYVPINFDNGDYTTNFYCSSNTGIIVINYSGTVSNGMDITSNYLDIGEVYFTTIDSTKNANLSLNKTNSVVRKSDNNGCIPISGSNLTTPLPVTWLYVTLLESNIIKWATTASEINNSHFVIMKSLDGSNWHEIGQVKGQGTSLNINKYIFNDDDDYQNNNFEIFYKIKQIDFDGKFEFSNIIKRIHDSKENLTIFEFDNILSVNISGFVEEPFVLKIYDNSGRLINLDKIYESKDINLHGLTPGIYYIFVNSVSSSNFSKTKKIIIEK